MKAWIKKLTSRKFLVSVVAMAAGIAALCGADRTVVTVLSGTAMTVLPAIVYCLSEGRIDAASVATAGKALSDAAQALGADSAVADVIDAAADAAAALGEREPK